MTDLARQLRLYQYAVLALLVLLGVAVYLALREPAQTAAPTSATATAPEMAVPSAPTVPVHPPPKIRVVDLQKRMIEVVRGREGAADISEGYYDSPAVSVHMHVLGHGQRVPLHFHKNSEELTVILSGVPEVTHVHGTDLTPATARPGEDALVYSPPMCGHAWLNTAADAFQANLVIAMPPFEGNFYVEPDDPRLKSGAAPVILTPADDSKGLAASTLPFMNGSATVLFVRGEQTLEPEPTSATLLLILEGEGTFQRVEPIPLRRHVLLTVPPAWGGVIRSSETAPLRILVLKPDRVATDGGAD